MSEFTDSQRVFRQVDTEPENAVIAAGGSNPLEEKLPFRVGTHITAPIVRQSGEIYGTLCCFSFRPKEDPDQRELKRLQYTAQLTANRIDQGRSALRHGPK